MGISSRNSIIPLLKEFSSRKLIVVANVCLRKMEFLQLSHHPLVEWEFRPEIRIVPSVLVVFLNKCGYLRIISSSRSSVNSGTRFEFHRTLTIGMRLCLWVLTSRSIISTGSSMNRSFSSTCISSKGITNVSSDKHFLRFEIWKTLWTPLSSSGRLSRYATGPILFRISNGPRYHGLSLPRLPKRTTPFQGETFRRTLSPTWNSKGLRRWSA